MTAFAGLAWAGLSQSQAWSVSSGHYARIPDKKKNFSGVAVHRLSVRCMHLHSALSCLQAEEGAGCMATAACG